MTWLLIGVGVLVAVVLLGWLARSLFRIAREQTLAERYPGCPAHLLEQCHAFHLAQQRATARFYRRVKMETRNANPSWLQQRLREMARGKR